MVDDQQAPKTKKHHRHHRKHHRILRIIVMIVAILLVGVGIVVARTYYNLRQSVDSTHQTVKVSKRRNPTTTLSTQRPVSILLLGTDTGALNRSYKGRTDTLMVATVNPISQKVLLMSIPRDTEVKIKGFESEFPSKINAAYAYGDAGTTITTVQNWLNIPIDYYMLINMGGLEKVINDLGGVLITPTLSFTESDYSFKKGTPQLMTGKTALAYSRMRHQDPQGDYGRQARQRQVLSAVLKKEANIGTLLQSNRIKELAKNVKTDMTFTDMTNLALHYRAAAQTIESDHVQGQGKMIDGQSFEVVSQTEKQRVTNKIRKALGLDPAKTGPQFSEK